MAQKVKQSDSDAELRAAFDVFDKDGNGTISADELRSLMKSIGEELTDQDIDEMLKEADKDGDGTIDCQSFPYSRLTVNVFDRTILFKSRQEGPIICSLHSSHGLGAD